MERRHFLKIAIGVAAGAAALAASAQAAPLAAQLLAKDSMPPAREGAIPAVTTEAEVDRLKPEQVRWGHHGHGHHWGWRHRWHRHWHRRHWGWRRHHWHRHWHRHHW
jgi:hypothetical protein